MERVQGRISIVRIACPYCGASFVCFSHDAPSHWSCAKCRRPVTIDMAPEDEELVVFLSILVGDDVTVESISEDY